MKVRRIDFSPDEWIAGAFTLKADQRGCYITIIMLIYSQGGPILDDPREMATACNVSLDKWRKIRAVLLEKGKIYLTDEGRISNRRCENELKKAQNRTENARKNGEKGGKNSAVSRKNIPPVSRDNKDLAEADASPNREANHQLPTINHQSSSKEPESESADRPVPAAAWKPIDYIRAIKPTVLSMWALADWKFTGQTAEVCREWAIADIAPDSVLAAILPVLTRRREKGEVPPRSLAFFREIVAEAEGAAADAGPQSDWYRAYNEAVDSWQRNGCRGEGPKLDDYRPKRKAA